MSVSRRRRRPCWSVAIGSRPAGSDARSKIARLLATFPLVGGSGSSILVTVQSRHRDPRRNFTGPGKSSRWGRLRGRRQRRPAGHVSGGGRHRLAVTLLLRIPPHLAPWATSGVTVLGFADAPLPRSRRLRALRPSRCNLSIPKTLPPHGHALTLLLGIPPHLAPWGRTSRVLGFADLPLPRSRTLPAPLLPSRCNNLSILKTLPPDHGHALEPGLLSGGRDVLDWWQPLATHRIRHLASALGLASCAQTHLSPSHIRLQLQLPPGCGSPVN